LIRVAANLCPDEQQIARRFVFEADRQQYLGCRGMLRAILGACLKRNPATLEFWTDPGGKPHLCDDELFFNLSHSGDMAAIVVARGRRVGIDIQAAASVRSPARVAQRFFSRRESDKVNALTGEAQRRAFCDCWTRKEAYVKALGAGMSLPLSSFEVTLLPDEPVRLLKPAAIDTSDWRLAAIDVGRGYAGAVAVEGTGWTLWLGTWGLEGIPDRLGRCAIA
jgi:4'-phosphopantetheinyl transferase